MQSYGMWSILVISVTLLNHAHISRSSKSSPASLAPLQLWVNCTFHLAPKGCDNWKGLVWQCIARVLSEKIKKNLGSRARLAIQFQLFCHLQILEIAPASSRKSELPVWLLPFVLGTLFVGPVVIEMSTQCCVDQLKWCLSPPRSFIGLITSIFTRISKRS